MAQFLVVYKSFTTTEHVIDVMFESYLSQEATIGVSEENLLGYMWAKRQRIMYVLTKWCKNQPEDFFGNGSLCAKVKQLLERMQEPALMEAFESVGIDYYAIVNMASNFLLECSWIPNTSSFDVE